MPTLQKPVPILNKKKSRILVPDEFQKKLPNMKLGWVTKKLYNKIYRGRVFSLPRCWIRVNHDIIAFFDVSISKEVRVLCVISTITVQCYFNRVIAKFSNKAAVALSYWLSIDFWLRHRTVPNFPSYMIYFKDALSGLRQFFKIYFLFNFKSSFRSQDN